ncbi:MAG: FKBP-type peptidyl-prolyl cis-trans isomerase [Bacteroidales bacterium]|jgi:FKBP-type peptidyl-prolyl cis-trans isomerase FklB|nr:FKBP-type peptidyl-prolyl cis-trans isomerase [Bacteroidales bacterium]
MNKSIFLPAIILLSAVLVFSCSTSEKSSKDEKVELTTKADSASWIIGIQIADNFKKQKLADKLNMEIMFAAMEAQLDSEKLLFDLQDGNRIVGEFMQEAAKSGNAGKITEGEAFLKENAKRDEVTVTNSGLQYEILTEGNGKIPIAENVVKTHYHGTLLDGTVFDSSVERGKPAEFPVNGVIKGWVEALQMMPVGSKWKLYIPYDLAYGERGAGGVIGPYETLIFEIELIEIVK